jgi:hypothetical protein
MDNTINSLVTKAVGFTDQQVKDYFLSNPNLNDAQIFDAMKTFGVSPSQVASATGTPLKNIISRLTPFLPQSEAVLLGDTWVQGNYRTSGSGETLETGPLESIAIYKTPGGRSDKIPVGTEVQSYLPNGELVNTSQTKKDLSFFGGIAEALKDPYVQAAILGVAGGAGAFDGLLSGTSAAGTGAGSAFELANAGAGAFGGGSSLGSLGTLGTAGGVGTVAGMGTGTGLTAAGAGGLGGATGAAGLGGLGTGLTTAGAGGLGGAAGAAGLGSSLGAGLTTAGGLAAGNSLLGGAALGSTLGGLATGVGAGALGSTLGSALGGAAGSTLGSALGTGAGTALGTTLGQGLTLSALGTGLGGIANQQGITDARNLINQYGTQAGSNLANAYLNAQNLGTANRTDLANIYSNTGTNLQNLYNQQVGYQQPYQTMGNAAATSLAANTPYLTRQFTNADLNANLAPNYAFQLQQGQMANQRAANMGGGSLGGNALTGLQRYTQDYAGGAYQNAFNNFNTQRQNIYGNLADMAKIGSSSTGQLAGLGNQYGSNLGSLASNYGGNLTQGYGQGIGAANAYGLNTANLATGIGSALASNATQSGANNAALLSNLGNTALLGSMLKAT